MERRYWKIAFFFQHRTIFHSLPFHTLLFVILYFYWNSYYASALFLGYFAHIVGDALTPMGVKLFYPFSQYRMNGPVRVGSWGEMVIMGLLVVVLLWRVL